MATSNDAQINALRAHARADLPLVNRYPFEVRYAREYGWLEVRDCFTGEWLQVLPQDCPTSWRRMAYADKQRRRVAA